MNYTKKLNVAVALAIISLSGCSKPAPKAPEAAKASAKPVMTVETVKLEEKAIPNTVEVQGLVAPQQEAIVGSEVSGAKLVKLYVNVGDTVKEGQVLASQDKETLRLDYLQQEASIADAEALLAQANTTLDRSKNLGVSISQQDRTAYETQVKSAQAKLALAQAKLNQTKLQLYRTDVRSPVAGVVSSRVATLGSVPNSGTELFRVIKDNKLEWRAELAQDDLLKIKEGQEASINLDGVIPVRATVRQLSPVLDTAKNGIALLDIETDARLKSGMFVKGTFNLGDVTAKVYPSSAFVQRDGYSYLAEITSKDTVHFVKVTTGKKTGGLVEVKDLEGSPEVVKEGAGLLNEGDLVRRLKEKAKDDSVNNISDKPVSNTEDPKKEVVDPAKTTALKTTKAEGLILTKEIVDPSTPLTSSKGN